VQSSVGSFPSLAGGPEALRWWRFGAWREPADSCLLPLLPAVPSAACASERCLVPAKASFVDFTGFS